MIENNNIIVNSIQISCDHETSERCGAGGTFQVESIILDTEVGEIDVTNKVDQGVHYFSLKEVAGDLGFDEDIPIEEI